MRKIAIQGIKGSFHDIASHRYFEDEELELVCCDTFEQVFRHLKEDKDAAALVAIENTIAGSLLHNYELLRDSGMTIVGEHKLRISHSIMCIITSIKPTTIKLSHNLFFFFSIITFFQED